MLAEISLFLLSATLATCDPDGYHWQAPLSTDSESEVFPRASQLLT